MRLLSRSYTPLVFALATVHLLGLSLFFLHLATNIPELGSPEPPIRASPSSAFSLSSPSPTAEQQAEATPTDTSPAAVPSLAPPLVEPNEQPSEQPKQDLQPAVDKRKVAIVVVPEVDHRLSTVVSNALANLPAEWKVQVFHSPEITNFVIGEEDLMKYHRTGRLSFHPIINRNMSYTDYSELMKNASFWDQVQGEHVLTIQTDAVLCSNSPYSINDFLQYDWVGAPWKMWPHLLAGNGGLSLRRRSKLIETIRKCTVTKPQVEDMWYAYCFRQLPYMNRNFTVELAPQAVAKNFAVETLFSPNPLGVHKPWAWLGRKELEDLARFCPELLAVAPEGAIGPEAEPSPPAVPGASSAASPKADGGPKKKRGGRP